MFLPSVFISLLTILYAQSDDKDNHVEPKIHFSSFMYRPSENILSTPLTFILLPFAPSPLQSDVTQKIKSPENTKIPQIETSNTSFNCSALIENLNLTSDSIILNFSNMPSSTIIYYKCSFSIPNLIAYFLIDHSMTLQNYKELQDSIIDFSSKSSLIHINNKRALINLDSFSDLISNLNGCVPCAINQYSSLDSLSSDDLATIYLMLLSYNEALLGSNDYYKLNNACKMNPSIQATNKLLKVKNFRHGEYVCESFLNTFCETYPLLSKGNSCSVTLQDLITTILEFSNTCFSTYFTLRMDPFDYQWDYWIHYYGAVLSAVDVLIYQYAQEIEAAFSYSTLVGDQGSQIKLNFTKHTCDSYNKNYYLKTCGTCKQSMYEITAVFIKYNGYGDYAFRFIYDDSTYYLYDVCKSWLYEYQFTRTCSDYYADDIELSIYYPIETYMIVQFYQSGTKSSKLKTSTLAVSLDGHIFYSYYIKNINCNLLYSNGVCGSCEKDYVLSSTKTCYLSQINCIKYNEPYLRCSECKAGYGLDNDHICFKCSDNCETCTDSNCVKCFDGFSLVAEKTCSPCKSNCSKCSYTLCLDCTDGYALHSNNTCIKCATGCSKCSDLYTCTECIDGYTLNKDDINSIYCIKCKDNCLTCSESYCYECKSSYTRNPNSLAECLYCSVYNCEECDSKGVCNFCYLGYALNSKKTCEYYPGGCKLISSSYDCLACRSGYIEKAAICTSCVTCLDCKTYGCNTCQEENKCLTCYDGYYLSQTNLKCLNCVSPCKTCTDELNCSTCKDNLCLSTTAPYKCGKHQDCDKCLTDLKCRTCKYRMMIPSDIGCKCLDGYFRNSLNACIKCKEGCETCNIYGFCSKCNALNSTYYENLGCLCDKGFYQAKDIDYIDACKACNTSCKECTTENVCSVCTALSSSYVSNIGCVCDKGFYKLKEMNNIDACKACNNTCKECKSENVCSACAALNSAYTSNIGCVCDKGFYKSKEMNNLDACNSCQSYCKECNSENSCLICKASNSAFDANLGCVCNKGYYQSKDMSFADACKLCSSTCNECTAEYLCSVCKATDSNYVSGTGCQCNQGFYKVKEMNNLDACKACNSTCKECTTEKTCSVCLASNAAFVTGSGCLCNTGFYINKPMTNIDACNACDSSCKKCTTEKECIICTALNSAYLNSIGCVCDKGFYPSKPMSNSDACSPCDPDCQECTNEGVCLKCISLNSSYLPSKGCVCNAGFYKSKEMSSLDACKPCNTNCKECISENECSICTALNSNHIPSSGCVCNENYFQVKQMHYSDACLPCGNTCEQCGTNSDCLVCTASNSSYFRYLGCVCNDGFYSAKDMNESDACNPCNGICKTCSSQNECLTCTALNSAYNKISGCVCNKGFYLAKSIESVDACKKCNDSCLECESENVCTKCRALNSFYSSGFGCTCNEGYFMNKEMSNFDACEPCESNCKICQMGSNCSLCEENYYLNQEQCYQCGSLLPVSIVSAVFLKSFTEVAISFTHVPFNLSCENLFGVHNNDEEKFGEGYECEAKSEKEIFITLGTGSTLVDETVQITNFFINNPNDDCKIGIKFRYSAPLPIPTSIIVAPSKILINSGPLKIDGILSKSGYKGPLEYDWTISSKTSELNDYQKAKDSFIIIPENKLKEGVIDVELKVTNRFSVSNSINKQILCVKNMLIIDFHTVSNYSCKISQRCEYFISKITPFNYTDTFEYTWNVTFGESLQRKSIEVLNKSSIIIEPHSFELGTVGFYVEVINNDEISGSGQIFVDIIGENPVIVLDRAIGSISSQKDLLIDASQSFDPNFNCKGAENCLAFDWACYINQAKCDFEYDRFNDYLSIPKEIVENKGFDSFVLTVTSNYSLESQKLIRVEIVDVEYIPDVLIVDYFTKSAPSRIPLQEDLVVEAVFFYDKLKKFLKGWAFSADEEMDLGDSYISAVNQEFLVAGAGYSLTFSLNEESVELKYFYDFAVNYPPEAGKLIVDIKSGFALVDKFTMMTTDWTDSELDFPLLYSFGFFSSIQKLTLIIKQPNPIYSTYLTIIGEPIYVNVQVYDSIGDCTEIFEIVSVKDSNNITDLLENLKYELSTEMIQNIPGLIVVIVTGIINREYYVEGHFSDLNSSEISNYQEAYELCLEYLMTYVEETEISKDLVTQVSSILVELTLNPNLRSKENIELIVEVLKILLDKCADFGLFKVHMNFLYKVIENSFNHSAELININTEDFSALTVFYEKINKARVKNLYIDKSELIELINVKTQLIGLESYKLENSKHSLSNASVTFPFNNSDLSLDTIQSLALSLTYISFEKSENFTQNIMIISIFNLVTNELISVQSNSSIIIEIPFEQENNQNQTYSCLYFNYPSGEWDDQGCAVLNLTEYLIICECSHLSTFTAGVYQLSPETSITSEEPDYYFDLTIGIHIFLMLIYSILAVIFSLKDRKLIRNYHERVFPINISKNDDESSEQVDQRQENENDESDIEIDHIRSSNQSQRPDQREQIERNQINENVRENSENNLRTTGIEVFKRECKVFTIYFHDDSEHCRLYRVSFVFFRIFGTIFNISVSYEFIEIYQDSLILRMCATIFNFFLFYVICKICDLLFKEDDIRPLSSNLYRVAVTKKNNLKKVTIAVLCYLTCTILSSIGTLLLVQHFDSDVEKYWFTTILIGVFLEFLGYPTIIIFLKAFCWTYLRVNY